MPLYIQIMSLMMNDKGNRSRTSSHRQQTSSLVGLCFHLRHHRLNRCLREHALEVQVHPLQTPDPSVYLVDHRLLEHLS